MRKQPLLSMQKINCGAEPMGMVSDVLKIDTDLHNLSDIVFAKQFIVKFLTSELTMYSVKGVGENETDLHFYLLAALL